MARAAIYHEIDGKKICTGCHKNQPIGMFGVIKNKNGKHIQKSKCTMCHQKNTEYWRHNHRERYMEYRKRHYQENLPELRYKHYLKDAAYLGREVSITKEEFLSLFNQPCTYCGSHNQLNGVDRIDNEQGYVPGNVAACCKTCNIKKSKMTTEEFLEWIKRVALHQGFLNTNAYA